MRIKTKENGKVEIKEIIKRGHHVRDFRGKGVATSANAEPIRVCFKCGDSNHLANSELCPEKKKQDGRNASGHARKYIERGCHLFLAHVTEKEKSEKRLEDVPVIRDFPEVFPDDLPGLPPS
ncbi:hypothetical protein Tco_1511825 [Tanacetum coccineum]